MPDAKTHITEASLGVAYKAVSATTQVSAGATFIGALAEQWGMSVNEMFLMAGFTISLIGLLASITIQWVWKRREFELKKEFYSRFKKTEKEE